ncbi:hypothetical protein U9M48_021931 [Paspalum notatum var. saurae]|uniref:FAF domain-containing protein n=1 Tax=Paspalum notatum var. saurae TaxID=547442 RepID=A0AAQ3WU74_PASNO
MMLLTSAPHNQSVSAAEKFSAPISGLRSLLAGDGGRGAVVTRADVVSRGGGRQAVSAKGDGVDEAGTAAEEDPEPEEDLLDGFWVSYGRRCPRRRLPPPIPSLVARGALRRTRTDDGRLVIRIVPVVRPECIRARRRGDRLTMRLVEHEDDSPMMAPPLRELAAARGDDDVIGIAQVDDDDGGNNAAPTAAPAVGGGVEEEAVAARDRRPDDMVVPATVPPPRVSSAGCFEDVFKYGSIGSSSLRQMPSLRMVH